MDKIDKEIKKYSPKERLWVKKILLKIKQNNIKGLDIKKLRDQSNLFRVRKGNIRIIFKVEENNQKKLISISRRNEDTYKF